MSGLDPYQDFGWRDFVRVGILAGGNSPVGILTVRILPEGNSPVWILAVENLAVGILGATQIKHINSIKIVQAKLWLRR